MQKEGENVTASNRFILLKTKLNTSALASKYPDKQGRIKTLPDE